MEARKNVTIGGEYMESVYILIIYTKGVSFLVFESMSRFAPINEE